MKRTLIYYRWSPVGSAIDGSPVGAHCGGASVAVTGVDGVEDFYSRPNGMVEIRMSDPDAAEYWVPAHQVLAFITEDE